MVEQKSLLEQITECSHEYMDRNNLDKQTYILMVFACLAAEVYRCESCPLYEKCNDPDLIGYDRLLNDACADMWYQALLEESNDDD